MSLVSKPKAKSLSPKSRRAGVLSGRKDKATPVDATANPPAVAALAASTSTATWAASNGAAISKKQKTASGAAVAVKVEPASTPRGGLDDPTAGPSTNMTSAGALKQQQTTVRRDKDRADKEAKLQSLKVDEVEFVQKYSKAFPNFVFHFDSCEPGVFGAKARDLGARIDKFFSRQVTHVVTARPVPTFKDKENAPPSRRVTIGGTDGRTAGSKTSKSALNPFLDETGQSDILQKALTFKMRVWDVKKFQSVINRLMPLENSPKKARLRDKHKAANAEAAAATLSHLLEDERRNGTRERDQSAPRPDYQYFTRGAYYVLCEDATGEYRTIIAREYDRPRANDYPEWPVLHETFLKPSTSKFAAPPPPPPPPAAAAAEKEKVPDRPIARLPTRLLKGDTTANDLRRSVSLNNLGKAATKLATLDETRHPAAADHDGAYIAASGNSVNITSNTTSAQSGAAAGNTFDRQGREKAIAELNRKTVAFRQGPRASAGGESSRAGSAAAIGEPSSARKRKTKAALAAVMQAEKEKKALEAKVLADHVQRELKQSGKMDPPPMKKRHSLPATLPAAKEKVRLPPREESKKPGYCENCRNKFEDFTEHIHSRRHRRFALNDDHFSELDKVLNRLERNLIGFSPRRHDPLHLDSSVESENSYDSGGDDEEVFTDSDCDDESEGDDEDPESFDTGDEDAEEDEEGDELGDDYDRPPTVKVKEEATDVDWANQNAVHEAHEAREKAWKAMADVAMRD